MLLQAFTDHLGGLAKLEVPVLFHFRLQTRHLGFMRFLQALLADFGCLLFLNHFSAQFSNLVFFFLNGCPDGKLFLCFRRTGAVFQMVDFQVFFGKSLPMLCVQLGQCLFLDSGAFTADGIDPVLHFFFKQRVANL